MEILHFWGAIATYINMGNVVLFHIYMCRQWNMTLVDVSSCEVARAILPQLPLDRR